MKLNRRKAIGALVGGASTMPNVAKQFETQIMNLGSIQAPSMFDEAKSIGQSLSPDEMFKMEMDKYNSILKSSTKVANGDFSGMWHEEDIKRKWEDHKNQSRINNINSLKSVTKTTKHRMITKLEIEEGKNNWIEDAKQALKNLVMPTRKF